MLENADTSFNCGKTLDNTKDEDADDEDKGQNRTREISIELNVSQFSCYSERIGPRNFHPLRVLGEGSFGKVFLVRKITAPKKANLFAMKVLRKASLKCKRSFPITFQTEGKLYLILEYLRGGDLFSRLSAEFMFTETDVRFYLSELALALGHLHSLGIIYRDLKPENVLLDEQGHVKIADFGLSKEAIVANDQDEERTFSFCGTVEYMAPEIVNRKGHGTASDWWSYGVLMFEMLTGSLPFSSGDRKQTMGQILRAKLRMPQFLSSEAESLLRALFKRNPLNRLGYGQNGVENVKNHAFFNSIDWDRLYKRKVIPPHRPICASKEEVEYFDTQFKMDKPQPKESPGISPAALMDDLFRGFTFNASTPTRSLSQRRSKLFSNKVSNSPRYLSQSCGELAQKLHREINERTRLLPIESLDKFYSEFQIVETSAARTCYQKCRAKGCPGNEFSLRIIDKLLCPTAHEQVLILNLLNDSPNIVHLCRIFESDAQILLLYEPLSQRSLQDEIMEHNPMREEEASFIMETITRSVASCHALQVRFALHILNNNLFQIAHRDIKCSNIIYTLADRSELRLCNFQFAKWFRPLSQSDNLREAREQCAKEEEHAKSTDCWKLGVLLYILLSGKALASVGNVGDQLNDSFWQERSPACRDLISKLLHVAPKFVGDQ
ncbi:Ribosomal protein S6 kinase alpha-3 [Cichlidogyrus casuarinus]|uniref:Ribosomal protein S6 kinase alpha-3 n=1 Tax=Cichlidogyrus casuarinus TaxID=1844966 RepID=A0ABD2PXU1_9PLAT